METQKVSNFALYVDERLNQMSSRSRKLTEKRINDIIFDVEMSEIQLEDSQRPFPASTVPAQPPTPVFQNFQTPSFMEFLGQGQVVPSMNQSIRTIDFNNNK